MSIFLSLNLSSPPGRVNLAQLIGHAMSILAFVCIGTTCNSIAWNLQVKELWRESYVRMDCTDDQYIECIGGVHRRYVSVPPEKLGDLMATAFTVPPETKRLIDTNNTSVQSEANRSTDSTFHKNRSIAVTFKSIELFVTIVTLWAVNDHEELTLDPSTEFIFATLGGFIILPLFLMAGLIVGEVSQRLLVWLNCLGVVHFSAVAGLLFYGYQLGDSSIFFSILTAILYAIDARVSSRALPTMEERRRYVRHTHG